MHPVNRFAELLPHSWKPLHVASTPDLNSARAGFIAQDRLPTAYLVKNTSMSSNTTPARIQLALIIIPGGKNAIEGSLPRTEWEGDLESSGGASTG